MLRLGGIACLLLAAGCSIGGSTSFALSNAAVDASYMCPSGAKNAPYSMHATIDADNPTSQSVDIRSASAVMVVAAVHGSWQQSVGFKYDAGQVPVSPQSVGARSKATLQLTIPSACTNTAHQGVADNYADYADYAIELTVATSAGTLKLTSRNKHRIVAS